MKKLGEKFWENLPGKIRKISINDFDELKRIGVSKGNFLDSLCKKYGFLLHGSVKKIEDDVLKSDRKKIFASNNSAIAIMRSLYSNEGVVLKYPYFISKTDPLVLEIHTKSDGKFLSTNRGFVYILKKSGFKNDPKGSWQFIKMENEAEFLGVVETEKSDFDYPVKILKVK